MQTIVLKRFKHVQDFTKGLSETQLKLTTPKPVAKYGMGVMEIKGLISGCEKSVLGKFWSKILEGRGACWRAYCYYQKIC